MRWLFFCLLWCCIWIHPRPFDEYCSCVWLRWLGCTALHQRCRAVFLIISLLALSTMVICIYLSFLLIVKWTQLFFKRSLEIRTHFKLQLHGRLASEWFPLRRVHEEQIVIFTGWSFVSKERVWLCVEGRHLGLYTVSRIRYMSSGRWRSTSRKSRLRVSH